MKKTILAGVAVALMAGVDQDPDQPIGRLHDGIV